MHDPPAPGRTRGGDCQKRDDEEQQDDTEDALAARGVGKLRGAFIRAEHLAEESVPANAARDGHDEDQRDDPQ